jgi:WD40 repeat protein
VPEDVLSADGTRLASILSGGNTIHIFDVATGKTVRHLYCPKASNRVVALSPDGSRIWANENDGSAILWNASTGLPVAIFARPPRRTSRGIDWLGPGGASPFSPDGRFVAATGAGAMLVIDARTGAVAKRLDNSYFPAFSSDSRYLAAVSSPPRTALIWDTRSWARIGTIAAGAPGIWGGETLGFSPDGKILAVAAANRIDFWNAATRHISTAYKCGLPIIAFLFSPDGRFLFLAAAGSRSVTWDIASGKQIAILRDGMILPAISPDGTVATDGMFMCSFPSLVPISYSGYGSAIAWLPGGEEFLQNAPDSSHILPLRRRRPDAWYGFLWLPQGCLTLLGACVSIWYLRRDLRHWRRDAPFVF